MAAADKTFADEIGVSTEVVEGIRKSLIKGEHFDYDAQRLFYTDAGKAAVLAALGLGVDKTPPEPPDAKNEPLPSKEEAIHMLRILLIPPNPRWVVVQMPDGTRGNVRVRDNRRLQPRLLLRCKIEAGNPTCYQPGIAP
jgi:hypothetical protein